MPTADPGVTVGVLGPVRAWLAGDHARVLLALGRPGQAAGALAGPAARHRLRESLCQLLMLACYRAGDLPGALAAYHGTRQALAAELGTDPGPALSGLLQQILRRDPALDSPVAVAPGACGGMAIRWSRR